MSIVMKVGAAADEPAEEVEAEEVKPQASLEMVARKSLDGNIMIMDHIDVDIIVMPEMKKILTLAKGALSEDVYDTQDRLFRYLSRKGVVDAGTVRSGNVYGSMEAAYVAESYNGSDPTQVVVFDIGKFIEEERAYFEFTERHEEELTDKLTEPTDSTDLGDVSHEPTKGSINPHGTGWKISHPSASPFYQE
jgi:hypothetical protein